MRIAFFGLGNMGNPMAANLIRSGQHDVSVFDLDTSKGEHLVAAGGQWITDIPTTLAQADIIMTSLPGPKQIDAFAFNHEGVFAHAKAGACWLELSTNNMATCQKIVAAAKDNGISYLDAPVSGGDEGARAASLTILVGGEAAVFEHYLPVLELLGKNITHLGPNGAGYAAKIAQVILCYLHTIALSEALMLGVKAGVDTSAMLTIIQNSTGRSYVADRYGPPILNGDYDPSFALGLAIKDMRLAMELAETLEIELPMTGLVTGIYQQACEQYGAEANHLIAVRLLEEASNTELRATKSV